MKSIWDIVMEADEKDPTAVTTGDADNASPDSTEEADPTATDYSEDSPNDDDDNTTEDTGDDDTDDETTDYGEDTTTDDEDAGDNASSDAPDDSASEEPSEEQGENSTFIDDFLALYYSLQSTINRLTELDKSNKIINKIVSRVVTNLTNIQTEVFNYVRFKFSKSNFAGNLMKYNYFVEAYKINLTILRKTNGLITGGLNNTVKNKRKEVR